jgi:predicted dehydrogenase
MVPKIEGRVGVCLVGAGVIGGVHALALSTVSHLFPEIPHPELVSVADTDQAVADEAQRRYGYQTATTDIAAAVADPRVDLVVVSTPAALGPAVVRQALIAGKHVFSEKPLATSAREAADLYELAERIGARHLLGTAYRWVPAVRAIQRLVQSGELGAIHHVRGTFHIDSASDPEAPRAWRYQRSLAGGGATADLGYHVIDTLRFIVGEIDSAVATTFRYINDRPLPGRPTERAPVDVEDGSVALVSFEGGAVGVIDVSRVSIGRKFSLRVEIFGADGSAVWDLEDPERFHVARRTPSGVNPFETVIVGPSHPGADEILIGRWPYTGLGFLGPEVVMWANFLRSLEDDTRVGADFLDGVRNNAVLDAIYRSAERGERAAVEQPIGVEA